MVTKAKARRFKTDLAALRFEDTAQVKQEERQAHANNNQAWNPRRLISLASEASKASTVVVERSTIVIARTSSCCSNPRRIS